MPSHTYQPITTPDKTYIPVSTLTPKGTRTETLIWTAIPAWTWNTLSNSGKIHWCDWYQPTAWIDAWDSLTTPAKSYTSVTKSDRTYTSITTPSQTYTTVTK